MQSEDVDTGEERKTLKQQLQEHKERKLKEYQEKLQSQNSSYILDESAAQFYADLKQKELEKELEIKQREASELRRFKLQKAKKKQPTTSTIGDVSIKKKENPGKTINIATKINTSQIKLKVKPKTSVSPKNTENESLKDLQKQSQIKENIVNYSSSDED